MSAMSIPEQLLVDFELLEYAQSAIRAFVIEHRESYLVTHSNTTRHIIVCHDTTCEFRIRVTVLKGPRYGVTQYIAYSCSPAMHQNFRADHSIAFLAE